MKKKIKKKPKKIVSSTEITMNVWQPACRPGPNVQAGWREMQSLVFGGTQARAARVSCAGVRLSPPAHPCCGVDGALLRVIWWHPCRAGMAERVVPSKPHVVPSDGHHTRDGHRSSGHFALRWSGESSSSSRT